jgi:hypothetical protein
MNEQKKYRKSIPKALKDKLWDDTFGKEAGEGNCRVCNTIINSKSFEAGHKIAVAKGGETTLNNLECICSTCNKSMGTQNLEDFRDIYFFPQKKRIKSFSFKEIKVIKSKRITNDFLNVNKYENKKECWICCSKKEENKKKFNCCKINCHVSCWKKYLFLLRDVCGKKVFLQRTKDCPKCLDWNYHIYDVVENYWK